MCNMDKKVRETLNRKQEELAQVTKLQESEKNQDTLSDLDKNEIELRAQCSMLRHLLS